MKVTRPVVLVLAFALSGCVDPFGLSPEVKLPIADLIAPGTITPAGPADVTLTVVTGGCRVFKRIESSRTSSVVLLEAWGDDGSRRGQSCTDDIRYENHQYRIQGPFTDPLVISAVQPDGTSITRSVKVQ